MSLAPVPIPQIEHLRRMHDRLAAEVEAKEKELKDLQRKVADRELIDAKNDAEIREAEVMAVLASTMSINCT